LPDGRLTPLRYASSGQQEVIPLLLLLSSFGLQAGGNKIGLHIEEPEAHLFPATQRQVVEFIAEVFRIQNGGMNLVITTHSPYILTAFNNLLQAGLRYEDASPAVAKKLEAIVPSSRALKRGELTAYLLEDGGAKKILDEETHLVDAAIIDRVSDDMALEFDRLLWEE
jgi:predicted ATP-binding protein involved in virulence